MALAHSPKVVTDGLVFYYDQGNTDKSWKGAPVTNLFTETNLNNWSKSATIVTSNYVTPFDTPAYEITDSITTNYQSISRSISIAADSSSYTLSCMVRKTLGGTSARLGFNISFTGGTAIYFNPRFNSDTGVATYGTVIDYGDWWYWYFTGTNNSTNTTFGCSFYPATGVHNGNDDSTATGTAIVGAFMLVAGSTAVRFAEGTRSNTQALLDLTGQNTITATSLTYASNNTFSFDGANNFISTSRIVGTGTATSSVSWCIWTKPNTTNGNIMAMSDVIPISNWNMPPIVADGGKFRGKIWNNDLLYSDNFVIGTWYYVCLVFYYDATVGNRYQRLYVNGRQVAEQTGITYSSSGANNYLFFGQANPGAENKGFYAGEIGVVQVYNRALSAPEIQQNFNAMRGRYGI